MRKTSIRAAIYLASLVIMTGCTVHPPGERAERRAALTAGAPFTKPIDHRSIPPLPDNPNDDDLVRHALLANAELEQRYWEWRAAVEQIPQDGTQATNLVISANVGFSRGSSGLDRSVISIGNDPMADIVLPPKLSVAAQRALEYARAAGMRFRKAQFALRNKVLGAYYDYALTAELIRLEQADLQLLKTAVIVAEARLRAGTGGQQDLLKARNEVDLTNNGIGMMQSRLPSQRAALNALLGRSPAAAIPVPSELPPKKTITYDDSQILALAAAQNPELLALVREIAGRHENIALAKLQYLPDFSISAGSDLQGVAQSLAGMMTAPLLRHEAIDAAVAQAEANLRAAESMRLQTKNDLGAQIIMDINSIHDADRQLALFDGTILPRARQIVTLARVAYESGRSTLLDLLDSQRSLIAIERLSLNLRATRLRRVADLSAILARPMS